MNDKFLLSKLTLDSSSSGGDPGADQNLLNRRRFLKRTGGASVVSLVAWAGMSTAIRAQGGSSGSCTHLVTATPNGALNYSTNNIWDGHYARAQVVCSPPGGPTGSKSITMTIEGWEAGDYAGRKTGPSVTAAGAIRVSDCEFIPDLTPDNPSNTYNVQIGYEYNPDALPIGTSDYEEYWWYASMTVTGYTANSSVCSITADIYITKRSKRWEENILGGMTCVSDVLSYSPSATVYTISAEKT